MNETIDALNLYARGQATCNERIEVTPSAAQQKVLDHVVACHRTHEVPIERTTHESLMANLRADSVYDRRSARQLAAYRRGDVSLPDRQDQACMLSEHLSGETLDFLCNFESLRLLTREEQSGRNECGASLTYVDSVLSRSRERYEEFIAELYARDLIDSSTKVHVANGLFFVEKKRKMGSYGSS